MTAGTFLESGTANMFLGQYWDNILDRFFRARSSVVEHVTFNHGVDGSIPSGLTTLSAL